MLFADVTVFELLEDVDDDAIAELGRVRATFDTPEGINDGPDTAPSKRILAIMPTYNKRRDGPDLAATIGLDAIRSECRRFDAWVSRMESLGDPSVS